MPTFAVLHVTGEKEYCLLTVIQGGDHEHAVAVWLSHCTETYGKMDQCNARVVINENYITELRVQELPHHPLVWETSRIVFPNDDEHRLSLLSSSETPPMYIAYPPRMVELAKVAISPYYIPPTGK